MKHTSNCKRSTKQLWELYKHPLWFLNFINHGLFFWTFRVWSRFPARNCINLLDHILELTIKEVYKCCREHLHMENYCQKRESVYNHHRSYFHWSKLFLPVISLSRCRTLTAPNSGIWQTPWPPFKSNQGSCKPEPPVKPVWLSKHGANVFPAEFKEDEILRRTTLLFLLRSKSPLRPSGVNKGRCSKWYANWKKKKQLHKSTRRPCISDTSHPKRKFGYLGWNSKWGRALPVCWFQRCDGTKPVWLHVDRSGGDSRLSVGFVSGSV